MDGLLRQGLKLHILDLPTLFWGVNLVTIIVPTCALHGFSRKSRLHDL